MKQSDTEFDWPEEVHPEPTYVPERSRLWWLWRFYGWVFLTRLHSLWRWYHHYDLKDGAWVPRFKSSPAVKDWLHGIRGNPQGKALVNLWRYPIYKLICADYDCPQCGDRNWGEDSITIYNRKDEEVKRVEELFECVDSGSLGCTGDYYANGWRWCYRCGHHEWWNA